MTLEFQTEAEKKCFDILSVLSEIADFYGMYFDLAFDCGRLRVTISPVYADVGLAGVKERDGYLPYSLFYDVGE